MATTSLIVEIVVIGAFALIWVSMFVFKFFGLDVATVSNWFILYQEWSTGIILMAIAIAYQLGWSINQLSYFLAQKTFNKTIRAKIFKDKHKNYDHIKYTVFIKGSPFALDNIRERLSVVRLTRSVFLNFLLISVGLFVLGNWSLGLIILGVSLLLYMQAYNIYIRYCNQMLNLYNVINQDNLKGNKLSKNKQNSSA